MSGADQYAAGTSPRGTRYEIERRGTEVTLTLYGAGRDGADVSHTFSGPVSDPTPNGAALLFDLIATVLNDPNIDAESYPWWEDTH
jgi:hypothetical protein